MYGSRSFYERYTIFVIRRADLKFFEANGVPEDHRGTSVHPFSQKWCTDNCKSKNGTPKGGFMSDYKDQIEKMVYESRKLLDLYTREYSKCVDGYLMRCKNHGKDTFYHAIRPKPAGARSERKSINGDHNMIKALARKEYLEKVVEVLQTNVDILEKAGSGLRYADIDHLRVKMARAFEGLPDEYFFDGWLDRPEIYTKDNYLEGIRRHADWAKEPFEQSNYKIEGRRFPTSAGFDVRSKSEQSIVEQLVNYGVPFRYEEVIRIAGKAYSADFTFRTRQMDRYYWEHAGMMDDPVYANRHKRKMNDFERIGIVPWKNLIITYDMNGVINVPLIKSIIENEILPKL